MERDVATDSHAVGRSPLRAVVLGWALAAACLAGCGGVPEGVRELDRADLSLGDAPTPPDVGTDEARRSSGARWERVELPDVWPLSRRAQATRGWYRLTLRLAEQPAEPWIVLLPRAYPNAEVWVNGESLGAGGRMTDPVARNLMQPLSLFVPTSLWRIGTNWIHVRFAGTPGVRGSLHPVLVGPATRLGPVLAAAEARLAVLQVTVGLALVLGLVLLRPSAPRSPEQAGFAWLGAGLVGVSVMSVSLFVPDLPLPSRAFEWMVGSASHWTVLLMAIGVRRACGKPPVRSERALMGLYGVAAGVYALVPHLWAVPVWLLWGGISLAIMVRALVRLVRTAIATRRRGWAWASLFFALWLGSFLLALVGGDGHSPWMLGTAVAGVTGFLWSRTSTALRDSIASNRLLEESVAEREAELEANHARVRELERARVVAGERERMTRDMHQCCSHTPPRRSPGLAVTHAPHERAATTGGPSEKKRLSTTGAETPSWR